jgi:ATP-dependent 26S proteasome regulatory subunit
LDRKIEIPLPNDSGRLDILKIHAGPIGKRGEFDWDAVVKLTEGFNGADMRNVCTEAGMFAIRGERCAISSVLSTVSMKTSELIHCTALRMSAGTTLWRRIL